MLVQYCRNSPFPSTDTFSTTSVNLRAILTLRSKLSKSFISTNSTGSSGKIEFVTLPSDASHASRRFRIYSSLHTPDRTVSNSFGTAGRSEKCRTISAGVGIDRYSSNPPSAHL